MNTISTCSQQNKMPSLIYMQHIADIIILPIIRIYIVGLIFLWIIPHIFTYIPASNFNIGTKFQREHFVATFLGSIIHYFIRSNQITITRDTTCTHNLHIINTFSKEHCIMEKCMSHILLRQIVFRIGIRARIGRRKSRTVSPVTKPGRFRHITTRKSLNGGIRIQMQPDIAQQMNRPHIIGTCRESQNTPTQLIHLFNSFVNGFRIVCYSISFYSCRLNILQTGIEPSNI